MKKKIKKFDESIVNLFLKNRLKYLILDLGNKKTEARISFKCDGQSKLSLSDCVCVTNILLLTKQCKL